MAAKSGQIRIRIGLAPKFRIQIRIEVKSLIRIRIETCSLLWTLMEYVDLMKNRTEIPRLKNVLSKIKNNFSFRESPVGNSVGGCANTIRVPQPEVSWEDSTYTRIADPECKIPAEYGLQ